MNESHYVPPFTEVNGWKQRAVCGEWVTGKQHCEEPACERCRLWLVAERETEHLTADDVFGVPDPSVKPEKFVPFDCTGGHRR